MSPAYQKLVQLEPTLEFIILQNLSARVNSRTSFEN